MSDESLASREIAIKEIGFEYREVVCQRWGGRLRIREMSGPQGDAWEQGWLRFRETVNGDAERIDHYRTYLLVHTVEGVDGQRLFTDDDVLALSKSTPRRELVRLSRIAMQLNGIGVEAEADAEKN